MEHQNRFPEVLNFLSSPLQNALFYLPEEQQCRVTEVRLRRNKPLCVICAGQCCFVSSAGKLLSCPEGALIVSAEDVRGTLLLCCGHSFHSCADQLRQGFVTLPGGHRVGVSGTARTESGTVLSVHDITSLNIRVAGMFPEAGDLILEQLYRDGLCGALIAGPPLSGKTTVLKSMIGRLSGGWQGNFRTVSVADERGELASSGGVTADVLSGYPKAAAIEIALRTLSPELICCDELSSGEADAVRDVLNAGVPLLATVHASSVQELFRKRWLMPLIREGIFRKIAFLCQRIPGQAVTVLTLEEFLKEESRCVPSGSSCCFSFSRAADS